MTGLAAGAPIGALVLLGALVVGVLAGRAKQRLTLLVFGLLALVAGVVALNALMRPAGGDRVAEFTGLYLLGLPLVTAYLAGWLCARSSWFVRLLVLVAAVVLVLVFPYAQVGGASAALVGA